MVTPHDPDLVPEGPAGEWFRSAKDGTPLTDEQYDVVKQRFLDAGAELPWATGHNEKEATNG